MGKKMYKNIYFLFFFFSYFSKNVQKSNFFIFKMIFFLRKYNFILFFIK